MVGGQQLLVPFFLVCGKIANVCVRTKCRYEKPWATLSFSFGTAQAVGEPQAGSQSTRVPAPAHPSLPVMSKWPSVFSSVSDWRVWAGPGHVLVLSHECISLSTSSCFAYCVCRPIGIWARLGEVVGGRASFGGTFCPNMVYYKALIATTELAHDHIMGQL